MNTLRKRLDTVEDRIAIQQHRELQRQFKGRSGDEESFFCIHGYWPENAGELPNRMEFTTRGIKTIVTTQWENQDQKNMNKDRGAGAP
jgi:ribonuclease I